VTAPTHSFGRSTVAYVLDGPLAKVHHEWGRLLYEPEWARGRRFRDKNELVFFLAMVGGGASIIALGLWVILTRENASSWGQLMSDAFLMGMGAIMIASGFVQTRDAFREMPFRVYERGVTKTRVGWWDGIKRRETLVPLEHVLGVEYVEGEDMTAERHGLILRLGGTDGERGEEVKDIEVEDALEALIALGLVMPQRLSAPAAALVGEGAVEALSKRKSGGEPAAPTVGILWAIISLPFIAPFLFGLADLLFGWSFITPSSVALSISFIVMFTVGMMAMLWSFMKLEFDCVVENAVLVDDELRLRTFKVFGLMASYRTSLPVPEIAEARVTLQPGFPWAGAAITTVGGERHEVPLRLLEELRARQDFVDAGLVLRNADPAPVPGAPLLRLNVLKCVAINIGMVWLYLALTALMSTM